MARHLTAPRPRTLSSRHRLRLKRCSCVCRPVTAATLDIDATVIACDKRAGKRAYDGHRGYQPVLALWAEQDVILADEFGDGNVPAGSGNCRVVDKALAALPGGITLESGTPRAYPSDAALQIAGDLS
jgi:hypothetical protein